MTVSSVNFCDTAALLLCVTTKTRIAMLWHCIALPSPQPVRTLNPNLSAPQRCNAERNDAQRNFVTSQFIPPFYSVIAVMPFPVSQHRP